MRHWLKKLAEGWKDFWSKRYGSDELSLTLMVAAVATMYVSWIPSLRILILVALVLLGWSVFRIFSGNIPERLEERAYFLHLCRRVFLPLILLKHRWKNRKSHKCYICPSCTAVVRIQKPAHRETIRIRCPNCGHIFEKKR